MAASRQASPTSAVVDLEVENVMLAKSSDKIIKSSSSSRPRKMRSVAATTMTTTMTVTTADSSAVVKKNLTFVNNSTGRHRRHSAAAGSSSSSIRRSKSATTADGYCSLSTSSSPEHGNIAGRRSEDVCSVRRLPSAGVMLGGGTVADGIRKSAFSPYKPTTVLTNLQRGNIETQTPCFFPDPSMHQLAAQGELELDDNNSNHRLLDEPDQDGLTPLMWASSYGQSPTVYLLLSRGANPHAVNGRCENALLLASSNGHVDIARALLEHGVDVDHTDEHGNTALMYAAFNNHACCAQELLLRKADITKENHYGDTAFCIAVARSSKQVQIIIERHLLRLLETAPTLEVHS